MSNDSPTDLPMTSTPTAPVDERREALEAIEKAEMMVSDLCHRRREWILSIPARPDYDPDIVICDALRKAKQAIIRDTATKEGVDLEAAAAAIHNVAQEGIEEEFTEEWCDVFEPAKEHYREMAKRAALAWGLTFRQEKGA